MQDVMLDLETLGTGGNAVILSAAAVRFDRHGSTIDIQSPYYRNIAIQSCLNAGLVADGRTIYWWLAQSDKARQRLMNPSPIPLLDALREFQAWWGQTWWGKDATYLWSHGSNFDTAIWDAAHVAVKRFKPWHYRNVRDTRTLFDVVPGYNQTAVRTHNVDKHDALSDAIHQAQWVQAACKLIRGSG